MTAPLTLERVRAVVHGPTLAAELYAVHVASQEAAALARESCEDPADVVASELWLVAAEADAYILTVAQLTCALAERAGVDTVRGLDVRAAEQVRRHPRVVALRDAIAAANGAPCEAEAAAEAEVGA